MLTDFVLFRAKQSKTLRKMTVLPVLPLVHLVRPVHIQFSCMMTPIPHHVDIEDVCVCVSTCFVQVETHLCLSDVEGSPKQRSYSYCSSSKGHMTITDQAVTCNNLFPCQ